MFLCQFYQTFFSQSLLDFGRYPFHPTRLEAGQYTHLSKDFASHDFVNHGAGEYGRGEVHANTLEGYHSIFKRGMKGIYQHCSERHLHRYLAEYDFRYSNRIKLGIDDMARTDRAIAGIKGKRLTYHLSHNAQAV